MKERELNEKEVKQNDLNGVKTKMKRKRKTVANYSSSDGMSGADDIDDDL